MTEQTQTLEEVGTFWPLPNIVDGIKLLPLLVEIQQFALETFDKLDLNSNGFLSADELRAALTGHTLEVREKNYILFLLRNIDPIGRAYDDQDGISPCGISRKDLQGISRPDLVQYFSRL